MHDTATLCEREPESFTAGDTVRWKRRLSLHPPSDGWTLSYYFHGPDNLTVTAQVEDDVYVVTISANESAALSAGTYSWVGRVEKAGDVFTVASGAMVVYADPTSTDPTQLESILAAIDAKLEGRITQDAHQISINGRSIAVTPAAELATLRSRYALLVEIERRRGRLPQLARPL